VYIGSAGKLAVSIRLHPARKPLFHGNSVILLYNIRAAIATLIAVSAKKGLRDRKGIRSKDQKIPWVQQVKRISKMSNIRKSDNVYIWKRGRSNGYVNRYVQLYSSRA
jgi:hypothetical protein